MIIYINNIQILKYIIVNINVLFRFFDFHINHRYKVTGNGIAISYIEPVITYTLHDIKWGYGYSPCKYIWEYVVLHILSWYIIIISVQ